MTSTATRPASFATHLAAKLSEAERLMGAPIGTVLKEVSLQPPARSVYDLDDAGLERRLDRLIREWSHA